MLTGEKVALTELRRSDSEILFSWINDPEVVRFSAPYTPVHESGHLAWFDRITTDDSRIVFGIRTMDNARIVGMLQLVNLHPIHRSAELIIRIGQATDRGRGLGSEAVRLAIAFGIRHRNLQRIWLKVFADNVRAIHAYRKAGMVQEGLLRRSCYIDGVWRDECVMAALANLDT